MNREEYLNSLPKKFMAAGALFLNEQGEIFVVHPAYKDDWEIPGGIVEKDESPRQGCEREIKEELGLDIKLSNLLCLDFSFTSEGMENLQFIFFGGILTDGDIKKITLPEKELSSFEFLSIETDEEKEKIAQRPRLGKRLLLAVEAYKNNQFYYLEGGEKV